MLMRKWTMASSCVALLAVVVGFALLGGGPAHAQGAEGEYVDLAVILETPVREGISSRDLTITVMNLGSRTAYDVEVVVDVVYPENSSFFEIVPDVPIGTASLDNGGYSLRWTIPELLGMQRFAVEHMVRHYNPVEPVFNRQEYPHEFLGEVTTASFESDLRKGNNTDRVWSTLDNAGDVRTRPAQPDYSVNVSVDERNPSPGDIVNFTVTTDHGIFPYSVIDQKVAIELTDGLAVDEDANATPPREISYTPADKAASVSYSNGVFNLGTLKFSDNKPAHSVTLPIRVANDAVVDEQCLTATITGNPPPEASPYDDDRSDNVAKLCLGFHLQSFVTGQVDAFTVFPCVGITDAPCDSTDDVRIRAVDSTGQVLAPGTAVFQVHPMTGRTYEYNAGQSVNDGNTVSWQTAVSAASTYAGGTTSGVELYYSTNQFDGTTGWGPLTLGIAARDVDGNTPPPGKVFARIPLLATGFAIRKAEGPNYEQLETTVSGDPITAFKLHYFLEFEKLGTYKFTWQAVAKRSTVHGSENCDPNSDVPPVNQSYCATETYIFHVGPMADLTVEDGGASSHPEANQHAMRIVAVNNGPDIPDSAQVTGLPTGAQVIQITQGAYDGTTGEWNIGELRFPDYYRSRGEPEPTLVLSASAGATANVSIANSENYEVCVGPMDNPGDLDHDNQTDCEAVTNASWNSTPWYDQNDRNSTATITAQAGTGGVGEGIPMLQTPSVHMPAVGINWSEVKYLYGVPVKGYEFQWLPDGEGEWNTLGDKLSGVSHWDVNIQSGKTRYYRVRAVNEAGVEGPWSAPIAAMVEQQATAGAPDKPVLTAVPNEPNGRTEILITWTKPVENGSAITSYTMQVADSAGGPWADVNPQPGVADVSYVYSDGLTGGTRKYFRMLATNMCDGSDPAIECDSLWSDVVEVTTRAPGISGAPTGVSGVPDGDTAIDVSWSAPADDGGTPITRYEVQWSADGVGGWNNAGSTPDGATLTLKNTGMTFGTTRYYRVAARNSRGLSAWSDPPYASATTLAGVPGQPSLTVRATDANTIALTWTVPADNGDPITGYEIEWSADGSANSWSPLTSPGASDASYDDSGLDPGTQRYYQIRAVNNTGNGSWSTARNATTPPAVPGAPTNVQAVANGENAIDLSWDPPTDDGGAVVTGYELHVSADNDTTYSRLTSPSASAGAYTHSGLQPGDGRHYKLLARNRAGLGNFSEAVFASTLTGVPTAPRLTARANGATEIKLSWTKPDNKGSEILRYELEESDDGNAWSFLSSNISNNDSEYVHTGLSGGTTKHYRIRAANANGGGQWSTTRSARTDAGGPDAPVLTLTVIADDQIDLSWTVPANNGSAIRGYWVERSADGGEPWERLSSSNSTTSYSDTDLYRGMTRHYRVAPFNGAGTGAYSNVESATTTGDPATAPEPPTLLRFSAVGRNQVTLAWDPPDDDGGAPVSGYEYVVARPCPPPGTGTCSFTGDDIKATTSTSASISGLSAKGDYQFQVRAVNPVGKGDWTWDIRATLNPSQSGLLQVSPVTVNVNEGATASYTVRLSHAPPHPVYVHIAGSGPSEADDVIEAVRAYEGRYLVPDGWTHAGGEDWSRFTHNWRQGVRVQFTAPEDSDADDDIATFGHFVYAAPHNHLGLSEADWRQDWYDAAAYNLVECTGNCNDADPANDSVKRHTLTGADVKVTVRDND